METKVIQLADKSKEIKLPATLNNSNQQGESMRPEDAWLRAIRFTKAIIPGHPEFFTPNEVVYQDDSMRVRKFRGGSGDAILIVPPEAGHHSSIADYDDNQSLVQTCRRCTDQPVYCIEWKSATFATANRGMEEMITDLGFAVFCAGILEPVHLIGLCQGGWLSTIFTALYPESVARLSIAASPIDTHAGGGRIQEIVQSVPQGVYEQMVAAGGGVMSGALMLAGWKMLNFWDRYLIDYMKLWEAAGDEEKIRKIERFRCWYEYTQNLAGKWYLRAVDDLFRKNRLVRKELVINGDIVDLSEITCPVDAVAGSADDITLPEQCLALLDHVSTPEADRRAVVIEDCGHIGVFMGRRSQDAWKDLLKKTAEIKRVG